MAEVTVKQLAEDVGAPVDRLLKQIVEAGLKPAPRMILSPAMRSSSCWPI